MWICVYKNILLYNIKTEKKMKNSNDIREKLPESYRKTAISTCKYVFNEKSKSKRNMRYEI